MTGLALMYVTYVYWDGNWNQPAIEPWACIVLMYTHYHISFQCTMCIYCMWVAHFRGLVIIELYIPSQQVIFLHHSLSRVSYNSGAILNSPVPCKQCGLPSSPDFRLTIHSLSRSDIASSERSMHEHEATPFYCYSVRICFIDFVQMRRVAVSEAVVHSTNCRHGSRERNTECDIGILIKYQIICIGAYIDTLIRANGDGLCTMVTLSRIHTYMLLYVFCWAGCRNISCLAGHCPVPYVAIHMQTPNFLRTWSSQLNFAYVRYILYSEGLCS